MARRVDKTPMAKFIPKVSDPEPSLGDLLMKARRLYLAGTEQVLRSRGGSGPWWMTGSSAGMLLLWAYVEDGTRVSLCHHGQWCTKEYLNNYSKDFVIKDRVPKGPVSLTGTDLDGTCSQQARCYDRPRHIAVFFDLLP